MTQQTRTEQTPDPVPHPSDVLLNLVVTLLAPMFLGVSLGNVDIARIAAMETVLAYRLRTQADLIAIAQIVAFGLAALDSLSLSMGDDLSLSMTLRLRSNANALNRSAEQNRRAVRQSQAEPPPPEPPPPDDQAEPGLDPEQAALEAEVIAQVAHTQRMIAEHQARHHQTHRQPHTDAAARQPAQQQPAPHNAMRERPTPQPHAAALRDRANPPVSAAGAPPLGASPG